MYHDPWLLHHISIYCISWECSSSQEKRPPVFIRFFSHGDLENQHNFICHLPRLHAWFRGFASRDISPTPLSTYTIRLMDYPTFFGKTNHDFPNHNFRTNIRLAPGAAMPIVGTGRQGNTSEKKEPEISLDCAFFSVNPAVCFWFFTTRYPKNPPLASNRPPRERMECRPQRVDGDQMVTELSTPQLIQDDKFVRRARWVLFLGKFVIEQFLFVCFYYWNGSIPFWIPDLSATEVVLPAKVRMFFSQLETRGIK